MENYKVKPKRGSAFNDSISSKDDNFPSKIPGTPLKTRVALSNTCPPLMYQRHLHEIKAIFHTIVTHVLNISLNIRNLVARSSNGRCIARHTLHSMTEIIERVESKTRHLCTSTSLFTHNCHKYYDKCHQRSNGACKNAGNYS